MLSLMRLHHPEQGIGMTERELEEWGESHMAWFTTAGEKYKDIMWRGNTTKSSVFGYMLTTTRALYSMNMMQLVVVIDMGIRFKPNLKNEIKGGFLPYPS